MFCLQLSTLLRKRRIFEQGSYHIVKGTFKDISKTNSDTTTVRTFNTKMKTIHITKMTLEDKSHGYSDCISSHVYHFREIGEGLDWRTYYRKQKTGSSTHCNEDSKSMQSRINPRSVFLLFSTLNNFG